MAKAVLISIRPEWVEKIARGEKTVEVRKTRPKLDTPFKCYIYCTQGNDARRLRGSWGKVIGEFTCDRVETIKAATEPYGIYDVDDDFVAQLCGTTEKVQRFTAGTFPSWKSTTRRRS